VQRPTEFLGLGRLDGTVTQRFAEPNEGLATLMAIAALDVPACKPKVIGKPPERCTWCTSTVAVGFSAAPTTMGFRQAWGREVSSSGLRTSVATARCRGRAVTASIPAPQEQGPGQSAAFSSEVGTG
jgi:hypothetical protein